MAQRDAAWKAAIDADEALAAAKAQTDEKRAAMHGMDEAHLAQLMDAKPRNCGGVVVDDAAAACALLERRSAGRWRRWRGRGVQLT